MVSGSTTIERVSQVEPKRLWNATVKDSHNFFPKVVPQVFSSVTCLEGDGGVGTIKQFNFNPAVVKEFSFLKERVDEIDDEKFVFKYTLIEGGPLGSELSSLSFEIKLVAREEGGCVVVRTVNYETLPGAELDGEKAKGIEENMSATYEKFEQYLLSNPNLYS